MPDRTDGTSPVVSEFRWDLKIKNMAQADLLNKITEGEEDIRKGDVIDAGSALNDLRKEFFET